MHSRNKDIKKLYKMFPKMILQTFCIPYVKVGKIFRFIKSLQIRDL